MRKTWVKRENIYYKPFYKQKLKITMLAVILMAIIFFAYQIFYIKQLQTETELKHKATRLRMAESESSTSMSKVADTRIMRGIRLKDYDLYNPSVGHSFFCFSSGKEIPRERVNDNYCDCVEDGSDEPETNACPNGVFYCSFQKRHITGRGLDVSEPSSRINDGFCDCCDGSDEWMPKPNGEIPNCVNTCLRS